MPDHVRRLPPLEPPFEPAVAAQLERLMPPGVPPLGLFRTFARHLPMAEAMEGWGAYVLSRRLSLSRREREIVIDRTCARCGCEYEWGVHVAFFGERVELTDEQVASLTVGGAGDACWTVERERLLIEAADSLHDTSDVADELWARLAAAFEEAELLDLLLVVGWYHAISFVARATRVPLEDGAPRFGDYGDASVRTSSSTPPVSMS